MDSIMQLHSVLQGWILQNPIYIVVWVLALLVVGYVGSPLIIWSLFILVSSCLFGVPNIGLGIIAIVLLLFNIKPLRTMIVTKPIFNIMKGIMPKISDTERTALDAGAVWVEAELFSGKPDFNKMMNESYPNLTPEEQAFMDGPVTELCAMIDRWKTWKNRELETKIWDFMKKEKFFGMIISKEYGGLGFSALAHSEVVMKLSSRSVPACVTVMVPNSLGPGELLSHYGTDEQKKRLLPKLAIGQELPCFALTEPGAGSDAGSMISHGEVFKGDDGKLYLKLNWNKRYITLAAVSTILGLAFKLRDPKNLLGKGEDVGITCALIPTTTPGVVIGKRHDPLHVPFYNCPTQGKDVVVPIDAIIGGVEWAGRGWQMLMESLAAGRGISLPSQSTGGAKLVLQTTSAYSVVRKQFGTAIGKFEGIEEPLARIAGFNYALEAIRRYTVGAIDKGIKPPVVTAICKYYSTEIGRKIINDGMDILGGAAISMGPRNLLAEIYIATPIGITVEGANILTRTLIIFGQGALRAHPYAYKEVMAVEKGDVGLFDQAFWGHVGHIVRNTFRSICLSLTRGYIASSPVSGDLAKYYRRLTWASATFAILTDVAMGSLGGALKLKEKITGRFADVLAWMYISVAVLKRYQADGNKPEDLPFVKYILKYALAEIQRGFDGIFDNLPVPGLTWFFKGWLGAWSRINSIGSQANDSLGHAIAKAVQVDGDQRNRMTAGIFMPKNKEEQLARLENAFKVVTQAEAAEKKIRAAIKTGQLPKQKVHTLLEQAKTQKIISEEDYNLVKQADSVRTDAIQVDDFDEASYKSNHI